MGKKEGGLPLVRMTTDKGEMQIELFQNDAPKAVANFLKLARSGFYDGLRFHRVIDDFVVQGGCPHSKNKGDRRAGTGGPGWQIPCETKGNPRKHAVGALSMAHAGKNTGGSQFFIVLSERNTSHLNGAHTVFGHVVTGDDVFPRIRAWDQIQTVTVEAQ